LNIAGIDIRANPSSHEKQGCLAPNKGCQTSYQEGNRGVRGYDTDPKGGLAQNTDVAVIQLPRRRGR
jgi:hypothetical protein